MTPLKSKQADQTPPNGRIIECAGVTLVGIFVLLDLILLSLYGVAFFSVLSRDMTAT
jgi:hypothetical protein